MPGWALCSALLSFSALMADANYQRPLLELDQTSPEMWMNAAELVTSRGYPVEEHEVQTADGYLLSVFRIAGPNRTKPRRARHGTPVLFAHGLASCSEQWLLRAGDNVVFQLADLGFDVWLGAFRGSFYGRRHVTRSVEAPDFWDFSWHENAVFDQAATIDYILRETRRPSLATVGHSMGSTAQVVLLAERPDYASKVLASVLMAPPIYFNHMPGLPGLVAWSLKLNPYMQLMSTTMAPKGEIPMMNIPLYFSCLIAAGGSMRSLPAACTALNELVAGPAQKPMDVELHKLLMAHFPAGAAIRQSAHYAQTQTDGDFRKFDFGVVKNMLTYGSIKPPAYDLSKITTPIYIYYSQSDNLVNAKDVEDFASKLSSVRRMHKIPREEFNHNDYLIGVTVPEDVNSHLIKDLNKYAL